MRCLAALLLCLAALFAALILIKDAYHWRTGDKRHASFRTVVVSVLILLGLAVAAQAKPSSYAPITQFSGDRYSGRAVAPKAAPHRRLHVARKALRHAPVHRQRHAPSEAYRADTGLSLGDGIRREAGRALGRPGAWCGWWLGHHLGMPLRHLWLARNWAKVGTNAGGPQVGAVVVWRHHVGIITGRQRGQWVVKSGNDGRRVRERRRSVAGAIAFRIVRG